MIVIPSDHYIRDEDAYIDILRKSADFALHHDAILTIGIKPDKPETGYGIHRGILNRF